VRNATRLLVLALAASPGYLPAQNKSDLASIQRDIADLEDRVRQLTKSQDEKNAAMTALMQQALDASNRTAASLAGLQKSLTDALNASMNDQQSKIVAPIAVLKTRVDETAQDVNALRETVADLSSRLGKMDSRLNDIYSAVTTPPVAAPPPVLQSPGAAVNSGLPPGVSAMSLRQDAEKDFSGANYTLALDEFAKYIKYFPSDYYAPTAQYHIGEIYFRGEQYDDAAQAYDKVVEQFPKNERTADAAYYKAVSLQKAGHIADAKSEYRSFISSYPANEHTVQARKNLATLDPTTSKSTTRHK
jgi:TolA-binding protein